MVGAPLPEPDAADDLARFPDAERTEAVLAWGVRELSRMEGLALAYPDDAPTWQELHGECLRRCWCWYALRCAQEPVWGASPAASRFWARPEVRGLSPACSREAHLAALRRQLGPTRWSTGELEHPAQPSCLEAVR